MVILDYITQTFWFKASVSSGWFVYKLSDKDAIDYLKKGYEFIAGDIGAVNEVSVELWIKKKGSEYNVSISSNAKSFKESSKEFSVCTNR